MSFLSESQKENRCGEEMTSSSCWGSWIQVINLAVMLPGSAESTKREITITVEAVTLLLFIFHYSDIH